MGNDHVYAIFLKTGEKIDMELGVASTKCNYEDLFSRLKLRSNTTDTSNTGRQSCPTKINCWTGPNTGDSWTLTQSHNAAADGWYFIIVDGGSTGLSEYRGYYTLKVTLTNCVSPGCACE
jgi:hypothetical protein